jgi:hypothetical protein
MKVCKRRVAGAARGREKVLEQRQKRSYYVFISGFSGVVILCFFHLTSVPKAFFPEQK